MDKTRAGRDGPVVLRCGLLFDGHQVWNQRQERVLVVVQGSRIVEVQVTPVTLLLETMLMLVMAMMVTLMPRMLVAASLINTETHCIHDRGRVGERGERVRAGRPRHSRRDGRPLRAHSHAWCWLLARRPFMHHRWLTASMVHQV